MKTCSHCQADNPDTATRCHQCGNSLKTPQKRYPQLSNFYMNTRRTAGKPLLVLLVLLTVTIIIITIVHAVSGPPAARLCDVKGKDLGQVQAGQSVPGAISFSNCGGQPLNWQALVDNNSSWLKLDGSHGTLDPGRAHQLTFTATTNLSDQGWRSALVTITSNGGSPQQAKVTMTVVPPAAKLCDVKGKDLGQVQAGQSVPGAISLSNCGGQPLNWQALVDNNSSWLKLDESHGTLDPGRPYQLTFTATTNLPDQGPRSALVTITSDGGPAKATVTMRVVGNPGGGGTVQQRTIRAQAEQSETIPATGRGSTPATPASGTVRIVNPDADDAVHLRAGTTLTNVGGCTARGQKVSLDRAVDLPASYWSERDRVSFIDVPVHVVQPGKIGNIHDCSEYGLAFIAIFDGRSTILIAFSHGFAGGTDSHPFTFVKQGDIDRAAFVLKAATTQVALANINGQLRPNEHLVSDPQCSYTVTSNHVAGDRATTVTVTVLATCTARAST